MRVLLLGTHPRKRVLGIGIAAAVLVVAGFLAGYARRQVPMHEHARILLQAMLEEDGATILRYVHPAERELNDLTPATTAAIIREIINTRYEAWGWTAEGSLVFSSLNPRSGEAEIMGRIPGVGRVLRTAQVHRMEGGRPTISLSEIVSGIWAKEGIWELRRQGQSQEAILADPSLLAKSWLAGFDRDEKRLRELGVRYHTGVNLGGGVVSFMSFDDRRKVLRDWAANPAALLDPEALAEDPHGHSRYWMTADQAREHKRQAGRGAR